MCQSEQASLLAVIAFDAGLEEARREAAELRREFGEVKAALEQLLEAIRDQRDDRINYWARLDDAVEHARAVLVASASVMPVSPGPAEEPS